MHVRRTAAAITLVLTAGFLAGQPAEAAASKASVTFKNGVLVIRSNDSGQRITVKRAGKTVAVTAGGKKLTIPPSYKNNKCDEIRIKGRKGDDRFTVDTSGGDLPPVVLSGGKGNDVLVGGSSDDVLFGGAGNDRLFPGGGKDNVYGGLGDDRFVLDPGHAADLVLGEALGQGRDTIDFSTTPNSAVLDLSSNARQAVNQPMALRLLFPPGFEDVVGSGSSDHLTGNAASNALTGGGSNDVLATGDGGQDQLVGGADDDQYLIDADGNGSAALVETDAAGFADRVSFAPTDVSGVDFDLGNAAPQSPTSTYTVQLSSATAFEELVGTAQADSLRGNDADAYNSLFGSGGADDLVATTGREDLIGGEGDDTYVIDGDLDGAARIIDFPGWGTDTVTMLGTTSSGATFDLSKVLDQQVTPTMKIDLVSPNNLENVVGTPGDDVITGNTAGNTVSLGAGQDTFRHHGPDDGVDTVTDMSAGQGDQVSFVTGGVIAASSLTINAAATQLRSIGGTPWGIDFPTPVFNGSSFYVFGETDTVPAGQLMTFSGVGGFSQGTNVDSMILTTVTSGSTIGGAAGSDRIIDASPNGNFLVGRDGVDVLIGGDGDDTLQGDRGFAPGVPDAYSGGAGADSFTFGEAFGGGALETFGSDTIIDFGTGADTVDLFTGLSVRSGLGTTVVTIWDGATDFGTIANLSGHLWQVGDFS